MFVWNDVTNRHCPPKRVRISRPNCPWLEDPDLRELMPERDSARDTWMCLRTTEAKVDFVKLLNRVKSRLIAARPFLCGKLTWAIACPSSQVTCKWFPMTVKSGIAPAPSHNYSEKLVDEFSRYFVDV